MRRLGWIFRWHNVRKAPVVLFVRLPIMTVGLSLMFVGEAIASVGDKLPGFSEYP